MTVWQWIKTMLIMWIPLVGIIATFYWAFSRHTNSNKRNYMRAFLFFQIPLVILFSVIYAGAAQAVFHSIRERSLNTSRTPTTPNVVTAQPGELITPMRVLQGTDGRTIDATVIGFPTNDQVRIRRADGLVFNVEMSKFSAEDVEYFHRLREESLSQ